MRLEKFPVRGATGTCLQTVRSPHLSHEEMADLQSKPTKFPVCFDLAVSAKKLMFTNDLETVADIAISPSFRSVTMGSRIEGATARRVITMPMLASGTSVWPGRQDCLAASDRGQRFIIVMMLTAAG
jgi:hypothetical protein